MPQLYVILPVGGTTMRGLDQAVAGAVMRIPAIGLPAAGAATHPGQGLPAAGSGRSILAGGGRRQRRRPDQGLPDTARPISAAGWDARFRPTYYTPLPIAGRDLLSQYVVSV